VSEPDLDLAALHLDVYESRDAHWNPEHGDLEIPSGWELLPTGDAFVTRTVKAAGSYWMAWLPRTGRRAHRRLVGLWAPESVIAAARERAAETEAVRAVRREASSRQRARSEERYRGELSSAVLAYLSFAPPHMALAETIADEATGQSAEVGSGRVGRTRLLTVEERAALAARAYIRHRLTDYEAALDAATPRRPRMPILTMTTTK